MNMKKEGPNPSGQASNVCGASGKNVGKSADRLKSFRTAMRRHPVSPLLYITLAVILVAGLSFNGLILRSEAAADVPAPASLDLPSVAAEEPQGADDTGDADLQDAYVAGLPSGKPYAETSTVSTMGISGMALQKPVGKTVYALVVEGETVGYAEQADDIYKILDEMAQPWINEKTIRYEFVEDVQVTEVEQTDDIVCDPDAIRETLSSLRTEEASYTVEAGDTFNGIALNKLHMNPDDLSAMNPDVDINLIFVGDKLVYQQAVPYLSVLSMTNETYQTVTKSPVEYIPTADLYVGNTKLKSQGTDGLSVESATVTYCNGVEQERTILATEVLKEPTPTEMYTGTTPRPATASKGYFIWPVTGTITSRFGWRNLWGYKDFHTGLDIACPYGTYIKAADGGVVTKAGWYSTYGICVIIRHDNGTETLYAHCSTALVSVGTKVYQGQSIARVGLTGQTSGPHCHFEVRVNGTRANPLNYLS